MLLLFGYLLISIGYVLGEQDSSTFGIVKNDIGILMYVHYNNSNSTSNLNLSHRELVGIREDAFKDVGNVTYLDLTNNHLTSLPESVFSPLENLRYLVLNKNRLRDLGFTISLSFTLIELWLSNNEITELPPQTFFHLKHLDLLSLNYNNITSLVKDSFVGLSSLTLLKLDYNQITDIPLQLFNGVVESLMGLTLVGNQIQSLKKGTFRGIPSHILILSKNKINEIEIGSLNLQSLGYLDLNENLLTNFTPDILNSWSTLLYLNLSHNRFEQMTDDLENEIRNRANNEIQLEL